MNVKINFSIFLIIIIWTFRANTQTIVELPRPNSGTYSFKQAEIHKHEIYEMASTDMMEGWENPYLGFCVHITESDHITVYKSFLREGEMTMEELNELLNEYLIFLEGNPLGVLITCSGNPEDSISLNRVLELLFKPYVQIFYVKSLKQPGW
ncbi:MAG: hypothetical protein APR63_02960 [Desulfuromonas sp. SDB]|nr:MAG: hypothetical protein APR63_02960 [Desulfuromonas sp. SDB]